MPPGALPGVSFIVWKFERKYDRETFVCCCPAAATRIYDANDSIGKVKQVIGGKVKHNFEIPPDEGGWSNSCAVRMSYVLNYTGHPVPRIANLTVSGADNKWYFYRVKDVIARLTRQWGKPDMIVSYPSLPVQQLANKRASFCLRYRAGVTPQVMQHSGMV